MLKVLALIILGEIFTLIGIILYKKSMNRIKAHKYFDFLKKALSSSRTWLGFCSIAIGVVVWLIALAQTELNIAYSLDSAHYILILAGSRVFLKEKIDRYKLTATLMVTLGIILIVLS